MFSRIPRARRGFTLVELVTAMAITAVLVFIIMELTKQSISIWKRMQDDSASVSTSTLALQTLCRDLESFQVRSGGTNFQWLYAEVDNAMQGAPKSLRIPKSARCIFFTCAQDRHPAIGSQSSSRNSYRDIVSSNVDTQGDVSAVGYRLMFRDQVLNLPNRAGDTTIFPLFSLYRQVISPRDTYDYLLGREDLNSAYKRYESSEDKNFLCENIVEMSLIFNIEYADESTSSRDGQVTYKREVVPILSSSAQSGERRFRLFSDRAIAGGSEMKNAHVVSAEISMTVLTEEGVALIEQVRLNQRHAPKLEEFFSRYTQSFARSVTLPIPL